ncbi:mechanosensitive ion channel family protein [Monashia sp. NPDC004114]
MTDTFTMLAPTVQTHDPSVDWPVHLGKEGQLVLSMPSVTWDQVYNWVIGTPVLILITVVAGIIARWLLIRVINRVVASTTARANERLAKLPGASRALQAVGVAGERTIQRTETMGALLKSITTFLVYTIVGLTVMSLLGIPLGPLLASASIGGVALAFGAQSLVKDFLSGVFMIIEDQYGVGDVIDTGEVIGTVENVSLRITQLRDGSGMTWYVRNGEILRIGNRTQGWSTATVDIQIAYDEDVERSLQVIREVVSTMDEEDQWKAVLLEEPNVTGVESMGNGAITIRVLAKTIANEQFGLQREIRERVKRAFDKEGIRSPVAVMPPFGGGAPV